MGKITIADFGTMSWLSRRRRELLQEAELAFYKTEAERMAGEVETMTDALKKGESVIFAGMTISAEPRHTPEQTK